MKLGTLARLPAAIVLILTALIGPLTPARAARVADPTVTITVWTSYTQGLLKIFDTMVADFE